MFTKLAIAGLITAEVGMTIFTLNRLGALDKLKASAGRFKSKVEESFFEGRYPDEYKAWKAQQPIEAEVV